MYKIFKFTLVVICFACLSGCASSCGAPAESNTNTAANNIIVPKRAENVNLPNANTNLVPHNAAKNGVNPTLDNSKVKKIDTTKVPKKVPKKKMPGNSVISTESKGASFVETRKFLDHSQLDKLVRVFDNPNNIKVKVHLKNGKVYELEDGKLKNYKTDSPATILQAVGVKPKTNPKEALKKEDTEKLTKEN